MAAVTTNGQGVDMVIVNIAEAAQRRTQERVTYVQRLSKQVIRLATIMAGLAILRNILMLYFEKKQALVEMMVSLLIPYCGYEGARKRNRAMINCFWGCNAASLILFCFQLFAYLGTNADHMLGLKGVDVALLILAFITAITEGLGCFWGRKLSNNADLFIIGAFGNDPHMEMRPGHIQPGVNQIVFLPANQAPPGVPNTVISNLPTRVLTVEDIKDSSFKGKLDSCVICLDDFAAGDKIRTLPCKHYYHAECIDRWMSGHKLCPLCNADIAGSTSSSSGAPGTSADALI